MLKDVDAWKTENPTWREDVDPAAVAAARLQHDLAHRLRAHIKNLGINRDAAADRLGMSRGGLWRLLDGYAPITLVNACRWASELGREVVTLPQE